MKPREAPAPGAGNAFRCARPSAIPSAPGRGAEIAAIVRKHAILIENARLVRSPKGHPALPPGRAR